MPRIRRADLVALALLVAAAGAYTAIVLWGGAEPDESQASYDIYAAHYPNIVYALESLKRGEGLLWNPFQNCGQPFLPSTLTGLLYPLHVVFLFVDVDTGFFVLAGLHLALAGTFAYLLGREYELRPVAALTGALAFMLGGSALRLAAWLPTTILGPYVWIPAGLWMTERLLKAPRAGHATALGCVLALGLLPGYPQISFFGYQLVFLRLLWALATERAARRPAVVGWFAVGVGLSLALAAPYLIPAVELMRVSVRAKRLTAGEIDMGGLLAQQWAFFRASGGAFTNVLIPIFTLVPTAVATLALTHRAQWRRTAFFAACTGLYMALALSPAVVAIYRSLPMGSMFRDTTRFIWIVSLTLSVLVGIGADRLAQLTTPSRGRGVLLTGAFLLGAYAFTLVCARRFMASEWVLLASALVVVTWSAFAGTTRVAAGVLALVVGVNLYSQAKVTLTRLPRDHGIFQRRADVFALLRARMSPQDRMDVVGEHLDYSLAPKVASVFRLPAITDYEPQTSRRFGELTVQMHMLAPMTSNNSLAFMPNWVPRSWPLFDLLATRYLVLDPAANGFDLPLKSDLRPVWTDGTLQVLENLTALPRARWVPRLEVISDPAEVMKRLMSSAHDPRRVAIVERSPNDGFLGAAGGVGAVVSMEDRAEVVRLRVQGSREGFVVLSDQDYPGWEATVNDVASPILLADYAFRAVRVPAGESRVVFRYRPASLRLGALMAGAGLAGIFAVAVAGSARRRSVASADT